MLGMYFYAVVAGAPCGNSSLSNNVNVTVSADDWSMFQSDPSHSGLGVVGLGPNYAYAWNYTTGNIIESSPAVVGDICTSGAPMIISIA